MRGLILTICFECLGVMFCHAQTPPANDNFSNRTVLSGTQLTFNGTLAGSTIESTNETGAYSYYTGINPTKSVWWSWTAPSNMDLNLQLLNSSYTADAQTMLAVYSVTNGSNSLNGLTLPALSSCLSYFWPFAPITLSVPATAGQEYAIQLIGTNSASYSLALMASTNPIILEQPKARTVYSNACVLFYVISAGVGQTNFTFQWLFNGTNISGETAPMLSLTNVNGSMAGNYSVIVSNANGGYALSQPAALNVSQSNYPISLSLAGMRSNLLAFSISGETGRSYRIQSSTNLVNWTNEITFPMEVFNPASLTSVVLNTNPTSVLTVTNTSARKFFRATPYVAADADAELCIHHLAEIRIAKILYQRDIPKIYGNSPGAFAPRTSLQTYFPHQTLPYCPDDQFKTFAAAYNIREFSNAPICMIKTNHLLEAPR